jgi:hypothetical protein
LEELEDKFHEEAVVLEKQVFDTKTTSIFGFANVFSSDKVFGP